MKTLLKYLLATTVSVGAITSSHATTGVKYGGMSSKVGSDYVWGLGNLTDPNTTTHLRSQGAGIYIHELAWSRSANSPGVQAYFPGVHTGAPVWETNMGGGSQPPINSLNTCKAVWTTGAWAAAVNNATFDTATWTTVCQTAYDNHLATRLAPICTPNGGSWTTDFDNAYWEPLRTNSKKGHAYCTDTPPSFYLSQPAGYRLWNAKAIMWATNEPTTVVSMVMLHPRDSANFLQDTIAVANDMLSRTGNLYPDFWLVTSYYAANPDGSLPQIAKDHVIGSENGTGQVVLRVAKHMQDYYTP
jgi:hypothetical protein